MGGTTPQAPRPAAHWRNCVTPIRNLKFMAYLFNGKTQRCKAFLTVPLHLRAFPFRLFWLALWLIVCGVSACQAQVNPTITLSTCHIGFDVVAHCATVTVPQNWAEPEQTIELHLARIPATGSQTEADALFLIAGGPGQSAVETYPLLINTVFREINQTRDIVLLDQRGTGQSTPLQCHFPTDEAFTTYTAANYANFVQTCLEKLDTLVEHYTTTATVKDLEAVRQALGYEQINLYGASYGSRVAIQYAKTYPDKTRSVILDGVASPGFYVSAKMGYTAQNALALMLARCASEPDCQTTFLNLEETLQNLYQDLLAQPREISVTHPNTGQAIPLTLTAEGLSNAIFTLLYAPEYVSLLPLLIDHADKTGDFGPLLSQALVFGDEAQIYRGLQFSVLCTEDIPFIEITDAERMKAESIFGDTTEAFRHICAHWPANPVSTDFHAHFQSNIPALILSGEADPVTPPNQGEQAAQIFSNSQHLIAPGHSHTVLIRGCIPSLVTDFVEEIDPPGLEVQCLEKLTAPPFFMSFTGPAP